MKYDGRFLCDQCVRESSTLIRPALAAKKGGRCSGHKDSQSRGQGGICRESLCKVHSEKQEGMCIFCKSAGRFNSAGRGGGGGNGRRPGNKGSQVQGDPGGAQNKKYPPVDPSRFSKPGTPASVGEEGVKPYAVWRPRSLGNRATEQ